jgi:2Fe-2S iron-sulfur cluster binding domain
MIPVNKPRQGGFTAMSAHRRAPISVQEDISFTFNGEPMNGALSDTVASALIASNVAFLGTSPTTGEPYRAFCLVGRCSDCLMEIDGQPGIMACRTPLRAGISVRIQSGRGMWEDDEA